jgi:hypothetical protein
MKRISKLLICVLCVSFTVTSAPRRSTKEKEKAETQQPQVIMVPVPVQQVQQGTYTEAQQDRDIMLSLLAVAANFGHIALHAGKEKPFPTQQVGNWINSIYHAAEVITRSKQHRTGATRRCK